MRPALLMAGVTAAALCLPLTGLADDLRAEEILDDRIMEEIADADKVLTF